MGENKPDGGKSAMGCSPYLAAVIPLRQGSIEARD
jgi:hypothetical protein